MGGSAKQVRRALSITVSMKRASLFTPAFPIPKRWRRRQAPVVKQVAVTVRVVGAALAQHGAGRGRGAGHARGRDRAGVRDSLGRAGADGGHREMARLPAAVHEQSP